MLSDMLCLPDLATFARDATAFHARHPTGHLVEVSQPGTKPLYLTVPCLDVVAAVRLADMVTRSKKPCAVTFFKENAQVNGLTLDVVVATDLATGRQAVARLSDGRRVRCGKVRHEGVETLMAALKEAREKDGGALAQGEGRTATPLGGRGRSSRSAV